MQYVKGEAPFALEDGKKTVIQTRINNDQRSYTKALMTIDSEFMVLAENAKCLLPFPSKGAIFRRDHHANLAGVEDTLTIHPDVYDELVEKGILTSDGKYAKAPKEEPVIADAKPVEEDVPQTPGPEGDPMDVNNDGVVDAKDVAAVATAVAENEESSEEDVTEEDDTATDPA